MEKKVLGRGLDALFGDEKVKPGERVEEINIHLIDNNPDQPRKDFSPESLKELAESIKVHGVISPIILTKKDGRFVIVAGERRYRACRLAGLETIPAIVRTFTKEQERELALIENIQRENLNTVELARAIQELIDKHGISQVKAAERLGMNKATVSNLLRILALPETVLNEIAENRLTLGHAKVLLSAPEERQEELGMRCAKGGWSVKMLTNKVKYANSPAPEKPAAQPEAPKEPLSQTDAVKQFFTTPPDHHVPFPVGEENVPWQALEGLEFRHVPHEIATVEEQIRNFTGTKVTMSGGFKHGKLTLEYFSEETLNGLFILLTEGRNFWSDK